MAIHDDLAELESMVASAMIYLLLIVREVALKLNLRILEKLSAAIKWDSSNLRIHCAYLLATSSPIQSGRPTDLLIYLLIL